MAQRLGNQIRGGGAVFSDLDSLLGIGRFGTRGISNIHTRRTAGGIAGQGSAVQLSEDETRAAAQFASPTFTEAQSSQLSALAARAAGQGLIGGAPSAQIEDLASLFAGQNRAEAFRVLSPAVERGVNTVGGQVSPFLQQAGGIISALSGAGRVTGQNAREILGASGQSTAEFQQFANPALRALSALGLGGDAIAAVAERQGASVRPGGVSGARDVGDAFLDFLAPGFQGGRQQLLQRTGATERGQVGRSAGFQLVARTQNRAGAAEFLSGQVQDRFGRIRAQAEEFGALGSAAQAFSLGGEGARAGLRRLGRQDLSRFDDLFRSLGVLPQNEGVARRPRGFLPGRFLPGNSLFRTIGG